MASGAMRWRAERRGIATLAGAVRPGPCRDSIGPVSSVGGRVFAVDPIAFELLIGLGPEQRALITGLPADNLVGLAAEVAALLPAGRPGAVGLAALAGRLVEVERLPFAVGPHAQVDRGDRRIAEVGRAEGLGVARAAALHEVLPQGVCVLAGLGRVQLVAALAAIGARRRRPP